VAVRARKGYWALSADDVRLMTRPAPVVPPGFETALATAATPARARIIRTWIGTSRGANGRTKVTFLWEPAPKVPGERRGPDDEPVRVAVTAAGEDATVYFRGRVPEAVPAPAGASPAAASSERVASRVTFDAPPGHVQLRLSVEGRGSQVLDTDTRDLSVPDLTSPDVALGTPVVLRARTVRELQQLRSDPDASPLAGREFVRTDRLLIRVPAYGPGGTTPTLIARLLNRADQPMADLAVVVPSPGDPEIEVPLASLVPGEYVVGIGVKERSDVKQFVGFRITG
jgi:hypothetical protein